MENITAGMLAEACGGEIAAGREDREVLHIKLDSRKIEPGDLFVPIIGARQDAHRFIPDVKAAGAAAVLTSEEEYIDNTSADDSDATVMIKVADTVKALQDIGKFLRSRMNIPVVAVTGSLGKTTTRELIAAVLSVKYKVFRTPGNSNSQVGVPVALSEVSSDDQICVIELGMSEPGELTKIARIAAPDTAVITNVGVTHIEQLGSRENILKEKLSIQDGMKYGSVLIVNADNDMLENISARDGILTFRVGTRPDCSLTASDIELKDGNAEFTVRFKDMNARVKLGVPGIHNVTDALEAIAVGLNYGITLEEAAEGLSSFRGFSHRQQQYAGKCGDKDILILDDSYNASPASVMAALDTFKETGKGRRHIAVLGDMKELGDEAEKFHREVGKHAAYSGLDVLFTTGENCAYLTAAVRDAYSDEDAPEKEMPYICEFPDTEELKKALIQELREGDYVLFKGGNAVRLFELADYFKAGDT